MKELKDSTLFKTDSYISGEWVSSNNHFDVVNPFDGKVLAQVSDMTRSDCKSAIGKAADAFKVWSGYTASKRARILKEWYRLQLENVDDLAYLLSS